MLRPPIYKLHSQEIRLKLNQFNKMLMSYLRSSLRRDYFEYARDQSSKHILLNQPVDTDFERHSLQYYKAIIEHTLALAEQSTSLEMDLQLLDSGQVQSLNQLFAVIYRSERKKILHNQLDLVNFMIRVVENSEQIKVMCADKASA